MYIVVHEANEYKETLINLDTVHFIRKVENPKCPNVKTLISVDNGLTAIGVAEDYESIKNYISQQQPNGFYELDMTGRIMKIPMREARRRRKNDNT